VRNVPDDQDLQATFIFSRVLQLVGGGIARDIERDGRQGKGQRQG
jgi:hypothetical protein